MVPHGAEGQGRGGRCYLAVFFANGMVIVLRCTLAARAKHRFRNAPRPPLSVSVSPRLTKRRIPNLSHPEKCTRITTTARDIHMLHVLLDDDSGGGSQHPPGDSVPDTADCGLYHKP